MRWPASVRFVWENLPILLVGGVLCAAGWCLPRVLPRSPLVTIAAVTLLVLPTLLAWTRACEMLLTGEQHRLGAILRTLPGAWVATVRIGWPGLAALGLASTAITAYDISRQSWMLLSAGVSVALAGIGGLLMITALPYALRTRCAAVAAYREALRVIMIRPVAALGTVAAFVIFVLASGHAAFPVVILLALPLPYVWARASLGDQVAVGQEL
ncbi:hypothetical protein [Microlunatus parietis]|uniref:Uncharacterized protein n=1 Tax=Microlunatus parietis TaxID=682979 RepID=A0A7Y9LEF4_9ACTN|nr:hypothetical protein [Microlunatus parietis]NYE72991.1 hypothetical protein [Microlunatus parietis]